MCIRSGQKRLAIFFCDGFRATIGIQPGGMKMAELDRIEAIDFFNQPLANGSTEQIKWMRSEAKNRLATSLTQFSQIIEIAEAGDLFGRDVEQHRIRATQPHFRGRNKENTHRGGVRENLGAVKHLVVERNCEHAEAERARAFQQLMGGIIDRVLRIIERVKMEIDFDPIVVRHRVRNYSE